MIHCTTLKRSISLEIFVQFYFGHSTSNDEEWNQKHVSLAERAYTVELHNDSRASTAKHHDVGESSADKL